MPQHFRQRAACICLIAACLANVGCSHTTADDALYAGAQRPAGLLQGGGDTSALIQWVRDHGGQVNVEVGEVCRGCMRGTLATKDIKAGELIASVPLSTVMDLGPEELSLPESSAAWIRRMHADPAYSASYRQYLDTLPTAEEVLAPEMWTPAMVAALQSPELAHLVQDRVAGAEQWWRDSGFADGTPDQTGLSIQLPLAAYQHAIACVTTRMFGYPSDLHNNTRRTVLVPVLDMANCADRGLVGPHDLGASGEVTYPAGGEDSFTMVALRDIAAGEEVTNTYGHGYLHRPDLALLSYGFTPIREPPIMSAVDLPEGFGEVEQPLQGYPPTPAVDPDYGNVTGEWTTEAELQRLIRIQAGLPTTLQEDAASLTEVRQPGVAAVLRWRVVRKRALLAAITQLSATLAARHKVWPCNQNYRPPAPGGLGNGHCTSAARDKQAAAASHPADVRAAAGGGRSGESFLSDGNSDDSTIAKYAEHEEL